MQSEMCSLESYLKWHGQYVSQLDLEWCCFDESFSYEYKSVLPSTVQLDSLRLQRMTIALTPEDLHWPSDSEFGSDSDPPDSATSADSAGSAAAHPGPISDVKDINHDVPGDGTLVGQTRLKRLTLHRCDFALWQGQPERLAEALRQLTTREYLDMQTPGDGDGDQMIPSQVGPGQVCLWSCLATVRAQ